MNIENNKSFNFEKSSMNEAKFLVPVFSWILVEDDRKINLELFWEKII